MAQTTVSVRTDDGLKRDFSAVCGEIGLSVEAAIEIFMKKTAQEKRIPFEVSPDPFYGAANTAAIKESIEQMRQGKTVTKTIEELEAMEND